MLKTENLASLAVARSQLYGVLSDLFLGEPTDGMVKQLLSRAFLDGMAELFGPAPVAHLRQSANELGDGLEAVRQQYNDLFVVPLSRYVTPYESVYRDEREVEGVRTRGLLMGESTIEVQRLYQKAGAHIAEDTKELPDHIGLEIAFMQFLCQREWEAWSNSDAAGVRQIQAMEKKFLSEHLNQWLPALCQRIVETAEGPFYKGIAGLAEAITKLDMETLLYAVE